MQHWDGWYCNIPKVVLSSVTSARGGFVLHYQIFDMCLYCTYRCSETCLRHPASYSVTEHPIILSLTAWSFGNNPVLISFIKLNMLKWNKVWVMLRRKGKLTWRSVKPSFIVLKVFNENLNMSISSYRLVFCNNSSNRTFECSKSFKMFKWGGAKEQKTQFKNMCILKDLKHYDNHRKP